MNPNHREANLTTTAAPPDSIFRALFAASIDAVLVTAPDGRILAANPAACRLFGRSAEELCAIGRSGVVDTSDPRLPVAMAERSRHGAFCGELTFFRSDGERFNGEVSANVFQATNGESCSIVVIRDVTVAMRTLESLAASEERYRGLLESAFDGIVIQQDGLIISVNAPYAEMFGYLVEELMGRSVIEMTAPEVRESTLENIQRGVVQAYTTVGLRKDGTRISIESAARECTINGRPARIAAVRNLTERKRAETELLESEKKYRTLLENLSSGVVVHGPDSAILFSNRMAAEILGLTQDQLRGKTAIDPRWCFLQEDGLLLPHAEFPVNRVFTSGEGFQGQVIGLNRPDRAEPVWAICNAYPVKNGSGEILQAIVTFTDITKRKRAEAALRKSQDALLSAQHLAHVGNWSWDIQANRLEWSDEMFRIFGLDPTGFSGDLAEVLARAIHPDDRAAVEASNRSVIERGRPVPLEYRVVRPDGTVRTVWAEAGELFRGADGSPAVLSGIIQDITERKQTEAALRRSQSLIHTLVHSLPDLVWLKDPQGVYLACNARFESFFGAAKAKIIGKTDYDFMTRQLADFFRAHDAAAVAAGGPRVNEEEVAFASDQHRELLETIKTPMFEADGKLIGVLGIGRNITTRKQSEEALKESEHQYRRLFEESLDGICLADSQTGLIKDCNPALLKLLGWKKHELIGQSQRVLHPPKETLGDVTPSFAQHRREKSGQILEVPVITKTGTVLMAEIMANVREVQGSKVMVGIFRDITGRKQTEEKLARSYDLLTNLARLVPGVIYQYRIFPDGRSAFPYASPGMNDIYEVMPEEVREDATPVFGRLHPEDYDRVGKSILESARTLEEFYCEFRVVLPRQGLRWRWCQAHPQRMEDGGTLWHGIISDITERKKADELIRESLREKESLLKEVHHRVKNNLQVITSLLRMEARRSEHPTTKSVLQEMKSRILSMALLHESLYRSGTFAVVDLGAYLKQLTNQSFRALVTRPGSVRLHLELASVQVEMDQALPCGLLVNELISNCLKHGFPGDHSGEVRVELHPVDGGLQLRLRVSDTGVGLPADFESKRGNSLGLQLVSNLARQIDGRLEVGPGPVAVFEVIFTPKYSKPNSSTPLP